MLGKFLSAKSRHHHVGQQHVNMALVAPHHFQNFQGSMGVENNVSGGAKKFCDGLPDCCLVISEENGELPRLERGDLLANGCGRHNGRRPNCMRQDAEHGTIKHDAEKSKLTIRALQREGKQPLAGRTPVTSIQDPLMTSPREHLSISLNSSSFLSSGTVIAFVPKTSFWLQPKIFLAERFQEVTLLSRSAAITAIGAACTTARKRSLPRSVAISAWPSANSRMLPAKNNNAAAVTNVVSAISSLAAVNSQ